jgi:hypothetical protein
VCYLGATVAIAKLGLVGMALNAVFGGIVGYKSRKLLRWINKWERMRQRDELAAYVRSEWTAQARALITSMERGEIIYVPYRPNETETLN